MQRTGPSKHTEPQNRPPHVRLRLYVSGHSDYTRSVVDTLEQVVRRYDPDELQVEVRDASEADETEHVFFTPMLIAQETHDRGRRTVIVGALRQPAVVVDLLAGFGVRPRT
jgi:hypothetical protein